MSKWQNIHFGGFRHMKHYNRVLALLLSVGIVVNMFPAYAMAEETDYEELTLIEDEGLLNEKELEESLDIEDESAKELRPDLEYLYMGEKIVSMNGVQDVLVGINQSLSITGGMIWYTVNDELEEKGTEVAGITDDAMLFQIQAPGDVSASGETIVSFTRVTYTYLTEDGNEYENEIVLMDEEIDAKYSIVGEEIPEVTVDVSESDLDSSMVIDSDELESLEDVQCISENEMNVYVASADGEVEKMESLEAALEVVEDDFNSRITSLKIALDPGHDKKHSGARSKDNTVYEEDLNLAVAMYCKAELETYEGVEVYMTRSGSDCPNPSASSSGNDNITRIRNAAAAGCKVYVAIHMNSATVAEANGAEVYIPNGNYKPELFKEGTELGSKILQQLTALGLKNRDVVVVNSTDNTRYPDGSLADYYTVNEYCKREGITGIIVEHGFMSNSSDLAYMRTEQGQKEMGIADATAIAQQYGLVKKSVSTQKEYRLMYQGHVQNIGWKDYVTDGGSAGTSGRSLRVEGIRLKVVEVTTDGSGNENVVDVKDAITYRAHVQNIGWMDWVNDNELAGTSGRSLRVEAFAIKLKGELAKDYDVYYRVHSQNVGWLDWTKNGALAGTADLSLRMEDVQIKLVRKGEPAPGPTNMPFYSSTCRGLVTYRSNVQKYGWMGLVADGKISGTSGESLRLEDIKIWVNNPINDETGMPITGSIEYRTHVQDYGWLDWVADGEDAGSEGRGKRIESIQVRLTGQLAEQYDVYYRTHCQDFGTLGWAKNGASAGSAGYGKRVEYFVVRLVKKTDAETIASIEAEGTNSCKVSAGALCFKAVDTDGKGRNIKLSTYSTHSIEAFALVQFEVWSADNGKDDVRVYGSVQTEEGTWVTTIDTSNHSGQGSYRCDVYGVRRDGSKVYLGADDFTAKERVVVPITVTTGSDMSGQEVFNYLVAAGLTKEGAAGLMGNLYAESGIRSNNLQNSFEKSLGMNDAEYTAAVDNGTYENFVRDSAGYGLAQWTYWSRKQELLNYRNAAGTSIGNCKMQINFLLKELKGYPTLYRTLTTTNSIADASRDVLQIYEKPATYREASTIALRESYSNSMYEKYAK